MGGLCPGWEAACVRTVSRHKPGFSWASKGHKWPTAQWVRSLCVTLRKRLRKSVYKRERCTFPPIFRVFSIWLLGPGAAKKREPVHLVVPRMQKGKTQEGTRILIPPSRAVSQGPNFRPLGAKGSISSKELQTGTQPFKALSAVWDLSCRSERDFET